MESFEHRRLERRLRAERPEPPETLVASIAGRLSRRRPTGVPRLAFASLLSAAMLVALASVGGISYAASAARDAVEVVKKAVAPASPREAVTLFGINAGGDQYRPGFGWGDPNHNHTGPPGLERRGGEAAPPLRARPTADRRARTVATSVTLDEQASLFISVVDAQDTPLLITQRSKRGGSKIGQGVTGPQTKFIRYLVLVPRTIPLQLRIPANLLRAGQTYRIRIVAFDPEGNRSVLEIPFTA